MSAIFKDFNNNSKYIQKELDLSELTWMDTIYHPKTSDNFLKLLI
jgi:hypothetical protein